MSPSTPTRPRRVVREYAESIIIAVILALAIRTFVVQAFKIPTGSMRMTLVEGDHILVNKFVHGARTPLPPWRLPGPHPPRRGDIVVFLSPEDHQRDFIKRLVAFEGEEVEIKNFQVWVNGQPIVDPPVFRALSYYNRGDYGREGQVV